MTPFNFNRACALPLLPLLLPLLPLLLQAVEASGGVAALLRGLSIDAAKSRLVALEGLECVLKTPVSPGHPEPAPGELSVRARAIEKLGGTCGALRIDHSVDARLLLPLLLQEWPYWKHRLTMKTRL